MERAGQLSGRDRKGRKIEKDRTSNIIDLLAILQESLDRALFSYNFIREVRSSGVRGSITIMNIRKFFK